MPELVAVLKKDERPVILGTAAWALGKIGGHEAQLALQEAKEREKDAEVLGEIEKGLALL